MRWSTVRLLEQHAGHGKSERELLVQGDLIGQESDDRLLEMSPESDTGELEQD